MPGLIDLIDDDPTGIDAIAAYLDGLDPQPRWDEVGGLDRDHQRTLYEKAAHAPPMLYHHCRRTRPSATAHSASS